MLPHKLTEPQDVRAGKVLTKYLFPTCHSLHLSSNVKKISEARVGKEIDWQCLPQPEEKHHYDTFTFPLLSLSLHFTEEASKAQRG